MAFMRFSEKGCHDNAAANYRPASGSTELWGPSSEEKSMSKHIIVLAAFAAAAFVAVAPGDAQTAAQAGERRCVTLASIDRTAVPDDRTVLFYMKDGAVFANRLGTACPGLARDGKFSYRVSGSQLCAIDTINVLEDRGFGFIETAGCALGPFSPTTAEDADALLATKKAPR
jgi:hypothetical protein